MAIPVEGSEAALDDQRFTPEHRIRFRREFLRIYDEGRRTHGRLVVVFCRPREGGGPWRLGLTVTRKTAGAAVVRNLLRRRVREYFRRRGDLPRGWDFVVNLKGAACKATGAQLWAELDQILGRLALTAVTEPAPRDGNA